MANINVVSGFPGSGKTTYVRNRIKKNDLVFDYDEIQAALTFQSKHVVNEGVRPYIQEILKNMIKRQKNDKKIKNLWIIRTVPDERFREDLEGCNVSYYYINKTTFECLNRINSDPERKNSDKNWCNILMELQNSYMKGEFEICEFIND